MAARHDAGSRNLALSQKAKSGEDKQALLSEIRPRGHKRKAAEDKEGAGDSGRKKEGKIRRRKATSVIRGGTFDTMGKTVGRSEDLRCLSLSTLPPLLSQKEAE